MKKLVRRIGRLLVVLVVVIVLGGIAASLLADNAARVAVEKASTRALDLGRIIFGSSQNTQDGDGRLGRGIS